MIKKSLIILLFSIILSMLIYSNVFAYSDDLFEFDMPSTYGNLSYQNMRVFTDGANSNRNMVIYFKESKGLKKSVWSIKDSDIDLLVRKLGMGNNIIKIDKRAKFGEEKAIKVIVKYDDSYFEFYILVSNKYVYMVYFVSDTPEGLESSDFQMIKKSFKLKDRTTNSVVIYVLIIIAIIGIKMFFTVRKNKVIPPRQINRVDYKNLTEEDLKK